MSKTRQRFISAFSAGREAYINAKKKTKKYTFPTARINSIKRTTLKRISNQYRSIWLAGWRITARGGPSQKQKKKRITN